MMARKRASTNSGFVRASLRRPKRGQTAQDGPTHEEGIAMKPSSAFALSVIMLASWVAAICCLRPIENDPSFRPVIGVLFLAVGVLAVVVFINEG